MAAWRRGGRRVNVRSLGKRKTSSPRMHQVGKKTECEGISTMLPVDRKDGGQRPSPRHRRVTLLASLKFICPAN
ncbi:hypothetical protein TYRP_010530 [Tyrophagus putrescentiae]|nr:hypothetical protein TYRP_010530 [Tyrophagus putrescentiae]